MFGKALYEDVAAKASVYFYQIGESQGFTDGNKRTGVAASVVFLALNGYRLRCKDEALYEVAIRAATHAIDREGVEKWLRDHLAAMK